MPAADQHQPSMPDPGRTVRRSLTLLCRTGLTRSTAFTVIDEICDTVVRRISPTTTDMLWWIGQVRAAAHRQQERERNR